MTTLQRRRWERYRKQLDVTVSRDSASQRISCRTLDVCEGGLGLLSAQTLDVGGEYTFSIHEISEMPIAGTVRWCTASAVHKANLVGVEFTGISAKQVEDIRNAIERWRMADLGGGDA